MRETDLTGFEDRASSHQSGTRRSVMGRPEGSFSGQVQVRALKSRRAPHTGYIQSFIASEWREYSWEPSSQHGFPSARRAYHQKMMTPRGHDLKRSLRQMVARHLDKIKRVARRESWFPAPRLQPPTTSLDYPGAILLVSNHQNRFRQRPHPGDRHPIHLADCGKVPHGHDQQSRPNFTRGLSHRKNSSGRTKHTVKADFAHRPHISYGFTR